LLSNYLPKTPCEVLAIQNLYEKSGKTVRFTEWFKAKEYVSKHVKALVTCVETGCMAGICGIAVTPDLNYWDGPRHQEIMGRYPQSINGSSEET
jgi:hypothetical protein